jgi:hypothetical protein
VKDFNYEDETLEREEGSKIWVDGRWHVRSVVIKPIDRDSFICSARFRNKSFPFPMKE